METHQPQLKRACLANNVRVVEPTKCHPSSFNSTQSDLEDVEDLSKNINRLIFDVQHVLCEIEVLKSDISQTPTDSKLQTTPENTNDPKHRKTSRSFTSPVKQPVPITRPRKVESEPSSKITYSPKRMQQPQTTQPVLHGKINEIPKAPLKRKRYVMESEAEDEFQNNPCFYRRHKFKSGIRRIIPTSYESRIDEPMDWVSDM